jgi:hypothetical protein
MNKMIEPVFSQWVRWKDRNTLDGVRQPGVYVLAVTTAVLDKKAFDWIEEIAYFGMTNSKGGLKSRLRQFDNTIQWKEGHGGAHRFRNKYRDYHELIKILFVSVSPIECDVRSKTPENLRKMGEIEYLEYFCFAEYVKHYGRLPEFNDKKRSPK